MDSRQELEDQDNARYGDPRRCPAHPHVVTSDPLGMFDAPCGECEGEAFDYDNEPPSDEELAEWAAQDEIRMAEDKAANYDLPF